MLKVILFSLAGVFSLFLLGVLFGSIQFERMVKSEVLELFKSFGDSDKVITEEDISGLPEPVKRYLRYTKTVGKKRIHSARVKQRGKFKGEESGKWMTLEADQYYNVDRRGFIWFAVMKPAPMMPICVRDSYLNGKGRILGKFFSLFTVIEADGPEIDQGALIRYFNEMMFFPTSFLNGNIKWKPIDNNSAKATLSDRGLEVSAVLYFNEKGELTDFIAERYMMDKMETWSTPIEGYSEFNGWILPSKGRGIWKLESGNFCYIHLEILEIEFNNPEIW